MFKVHSMGKTYLLYQNQISGSIMSFLIILDNKKSHDHIKLPKSQLRHEQVRSHIIHINLNTKKNLLFNIGCVAEPRHGVRDWDPFDVSFIFFLPLPRIGYLGLPRWRKESRELRGAAS